MTAPLPYFDLIRQMKNPYSYRVALVDYARAHGIKAAACAGLPWRRWKGSWVYTERSILILTVRHFHEKLSEEHGIQLSYSWVKLSLQGAGLVKKARKRGAHRKRRPRRPLPGMLLHLDGSQHRWFQDDGWYDLIVILDDATSEIYNAQLVEEESTRTVMAALREVIERRGKFCAVYSHRLSHLILTPKAEGPVDHQRLTQVGRALAELRRS